MGTETRQAGEQKPVNTRERARLMLALHRRIRNLASKTDIHSHRERAQLEQRLNELRNERG